MNNTVSIKGFKIIHVNIRSLWKNQHEFFIQFKGYDIITFSETWLHCHIPDCLINESGYSIIRQDRTKELCSRVKSKGGGLIIYVKNHIYDYITRVDNSLAVTNDLEHLWLKIDIPYRRKIILGLCFRPPSGNVTTAISLITAQLEMLENSSDSDFLVLGDFNINYLNRNLKGFKELKEFERLFYITSNH